MDGGRCRVQARSYSPDLHTVAVDSPNPTDAVPGFGLSVWLLSRAVVAGDSHTGLQPAQSDRGSVTSRRIDQEAVAAGYY